MYFPSTSCQHLTGRLTWGLRGPEKLGRSGVTRGTQYYTRIPNAQPLFKTTANQERDFMHIIWPSSSYCKPTHAGVILISLTRRQGTYYTLRINLGELREKPCSLSSAFVDLSWMGLRYSPPFRTNHDEFKERHESAFGANAPFLVFIYHSRLRARDAVVGSPSGAADRYISEVRHHYPRDLCDRLHPRQPTFVRTLGGGTLSMSLEVPAP